MIAICTRGLECLGISLFAEDCLSTYDYSCTERVKIVLRTITIEYACRVQGSLVFLFTVEELQDG